MINIQKIEDKKFIKIGQQLKKVLFQVSGAETRKKKIKKRVPLNISLVIDISGSMAERVYKGENTNSNYQIKLKNPLL